MSNYPQNRVEIREGGEVALYHRVYAKEGFEETAQILFRLVQRAQKTSPGTDRVLYLDIDGHRNRQGGFDADIFELQQHFILGFLIPFLTEVNMPLATGVRCKDNCPQSNDLPNELIIERAEGQRDD